MMKKRKNIYKRCLAFSLAILLSLSPLLIPEASAEQVSGVSYTFYGSSSGIWGWHAQTGQVLDSAPSVTISTSGSGSFPSVKPSSSTAFFVVNPVSFKLFNVTTPSSDSWYTGSVGLYFSLTPLSVSYRRLYDSDGDTTREIPSSTASSLGLSTSISLSSVPTGQAMKYINQDGIWGYGSLDLEKFSSAGVRVAAKTVGSEAYPVNQITLNLSSSNAFIWTYSTTGMGYFNGIVNGVYQPTFGINITGLRLISTASSADLEALEGIADDIAGQTEVLNQLYGDIMAILNAIYQKTGDIVTAQNLTNQYFQTILPYIESIKSTTSNIYSLLEAQFSLLIGAINTASTDIQSAISAQTSALIAYLDSVGSGAIGSLPDTDSSLSGAVSTQSQFDSQWQGTMTDNFNALDVEGFQFITPVLSGMSVILSVFGGVWDCFGDYKVLFTFPLMLAICLLLIGRISRYDKVHSRDRPTKASAEGKGGKS